jgi:hypothetical protein
MCMTRAPILGSIIMMNGFAFASLSEVVCSRDQCANCTKAKTGPHFRCTTTISTTFVLHMYMTWVYNKKQPLYEFGGCANCTIRFIQNSCKCALVIIWEPIPLSVKVVRKKWSSRCNGALWWKRQTLVSNRKAFQLHCWASEYA